MKVLISSVGVLARFRLHKEPTQEFKQFTFFGFARGARFFLPLESLEEPNGTWFVELKWPGVKYTRGTLWGHVTIAWVWRALCLAALNRVDSQFLT